jgi:hypothetical protein
MTRLDRLTSTTDPAIGAIGYDSLGNTSTMGSAAFCYDGAGLHVKTTVGSGTPVTYIRDAGGRIVSRPETVPGPVPVLRSVSTKKTSTAQISISKPAGVVAGDLMVAQISTNAGRSTRRS